MLKYLSMYTSVNLRPDIRYIFEKRFNLNTYLKYFEIHQFLANSIFSLATP